MGRCATASNRNWLFLSDCHWRLSPDPNWSFLSDSIWLISPDPNSGLTVNEWCSQNGYSKHQFYYWKQIAKTAYVKSILPLESETTTVSTIPDQKPLELYNLSESSDNCPTEPQTYHEASDHISVFFNDVRIDVTTQATDEFIARVIKAVRYA